MAQSFHVRWPAMKNDFRIVEMCLNWNSRHQPTSYKNFFIKSEIRSIRPSVNQARRLTAKRAPYDLPMHMHQYKLVQHVGEVVLEMFTRVGAVVAKAPGLSYQARNKDYFLNDRDDFLQEVGLHRAWRAVARLSPRSLFLLGPECGMLLRLTSQAYHLRA